MDEDSSPFEEVIQAVHVLWPGPNPSSKRRLDNCVITLFRLTADIARRTIKRSLSVNAVASKTCRLGVSLLDISIAVL